MKKFDVKSQFEHQTGFKRYCELEKKIKDRLDFIPANEFQFHATLFTMFKDFKVESLLIRGQFPAQKVKRDKEGTLIVLPKKKGRQSAVDLLIRCQKSKTQLIIEVKRVLKERLKAAFKEVQAYEILDTLKINGQTELKETESWKLAQKAIINYNKKYNRVEVFGTPHCEILKQLQEYL